MSCVASLGERSRTPVKGTRPDLDLQHPMKHLPILQPVPELPGSHGTSSASSMGLELHGGPAAGAGASSEKLLQVGELARAVGKTVRAIHHYEELGLLRPDARSKGRFRLYDPAAVTRVRWINKLTDLGMSLADVQRAVAAWERAPTAAAAMSEMRATYRAKLEETRAQISRLRELEAELQASIDYLDTCDSCEPPHPSGKAELSMVETAQGAALPPRSEEPAATCEACQRREREAEPDLVAGIVA